MIRLLVAALLATSLTAVAVHAQVRGKCLAAPPGQLLLRTDDGNVLHFTNTPKPRRIEGVADAIAVAAYHHRLALVLRRDGSVIELNDLVRGTPPRVVPGIGHAVDIAVGDRHAVALLADGRVQTWLRNTAGLPGDNTCPVRPCDKFRARDSAWIARHPDCTCPSQPPALSTARLQNATAIASGQDWTFAVLKDGALMAWGADYLFSVTGMLGADAARWALTPLPVIGVTDAVFVGSWRGNSGARMRDGTWKVWGKTHGPVPVDAPGLKGAIVATETIALYPDGSVKHWTRTGAPRLAFRERAVAITSDNSDTLQSHAALLEDGHVMLWGDKRFYPAGPVKVFKVDAETVRQCSVRE